MHKLLFEWSCHAVCWGTYGLSIYPFVSSWSESAVTRLMFVCTLATVIVARSTTARWGIQVVYCFISA